MFETNTDKRAEREQGRHVRTCLSRAKYSWYASWRSRRIPWYTRTIYIAPSRRSVFFFTETITSHSQLAVYYIRARRFFTNTDRSIIIIVAADYCFPERVRRNTCPVRVVRENDSRESRRSTYVTVRRWLFPKPFSATGIRERGDQLTRLRYG